MKFEEYDIVELTEDFESLPRGLTGAIVMVYEDNTYEVEFVDQSGNFTALKTISGDLLNKAGD